MVGKPSGTRFAQSMCAEVLCNTGLRAHFAKPFSKPRSGEWFAVFCNQKSQMSPLRHCIDCKLQLGQDGDIDIGAGLLLAKRKSAVQHMLGAELYYVAAPLDCSVEQLQCQPRLRAELVGRPISFNGFQRPRWKAARVLCARKLCADCWVDRAPRPPGPIIECVANLCGRGGASCRGLSHAGRRRSRLRPCTRAIEEKGMARYPIPLMVLARLAVRIDRRGRGLGVGLLKDALLRTVNAADIAGIRAIAVHAKDENARAFYAHFDFQPSPTDPLHLFLRVKDIKALIR